MNELQLFDEEKTMTVKEVAEAFGVTDRVIRKHAATLGLTENGKQTKLTEKQVTMIKNMIGSHDLERSFQLDNVNTDYEMMMLDKKVSEWKTAKIKELESQLERTRPMIESYEDLQRSDKNMSITEAAKHFGLHPKTEVFPYLRDCKYLTSKDLPSQTALDSGYLANRQTKCNDGEFRPQACVLVSQLETWRTKVIPQIKAWKERTK